MRTNIDLDATLIADAMRVTGLNTKRAVVEEALRRLVRAAAQQRAIEDMHGIGWEGDLDALRGRRDS